jgi:hypothetical protein
VVDRTIPRYQWQTHAVLWTPESDVFTVDNVEKWHSSEAICGVPEEIRRTCELRDSSWGGRIPSSGYGSLPSSPYGIEVDWVRVWQKK